jgi:hypothetical protein
MEQEIVNISLTVAEWNQILAALSTAPFSVVNQISAAVNSIQVQAGPVIEELAKKYPPAEVAAEAAE